MDSEHSNDESCPTVIIANPRHVAALKRKIAQDGIERLHVISDFDRTLTYASVNGVRTPSIISLLRDGKHLSEGYSEKANALFEQYHPIEIDPLRSIEEKTAAMHEWWMKHDELLIEYGLTKQDLAYIVDTGHLRFRDGVDTFLALLHRCRIPLIVFSGSGCGEAIPLFFKKHGMDYPNIIYVINRFEWDERGVAKRALGPIIHSFNKDETVLDQFPHAQEAIANRKNGVLLGDSIGDASMVGGRTYDALIKIGLCHTLDAETLNMFEEHFDIVLVGDGDFSYINVFMNELVRGA